MASIRFPEGTTFRQQFTINDNTGQPIDLTGAALTFAVYTQGESHTGVPAPVFTKTVGSGITITNAPSGVIRIDFSPGDTTDKAGTYDWELELDELNGDIWLAGLGPLLVQPARRLDG